jgi:hypothetical protein
MNKNEERQIIESLGFKKLIWKGDLGNCRCGICGDSQQRESTKRGYFKWAFNKFTNDYGYFYYCHNCGYSNPLIFLLKDQFPEKYKEVLFSIYKNKSTFEYEDTNEFDDEKIDDEDLKDFLNEMKKPKLSSCGFYLRKI